MTMSSEHGSKWVKHPWEITKEAAKAWHGSWNLLDHPQRGGLPSSIFAGQNMAVHSNQTLEEVGNFGNPAVAVGRIVEDSEDSRLLQALVA